MALEWAHNGVRVNAVAPGSSIYSDTASKNYVNTGVPNPFELARPGVPAKRLGTTEEVNLKWRPPSLSELTPH